MTTSTDDALRRELRMAIDAGFDAKFTTAEIADTYIDGPLAKHTAALQARVAELEAERDGWRLSAQATAKSLDVANDLIASLQARIEELEAEVQRLLKAMTEA